MGIETTYQKALEVLRTNSEPYGFLASCTNKNNYRRVWSRDGVVQGLASLMAGEEKLISTFEANLRTLKEYQDGTGRIPSNVDVESNHVSYGTLVGKVDATLWYVIGAAQYCKRTARGGFLDEFTGSIDKAMCYLNALELNGKGLIYVPTGGDWADEYVTHGYVLFDELLYLLAQKEYLRLCEMLERPVAALREKKDHLQRLIEVNYLPSEKKAKRKEVYHRKLYEKVIKEFKKGYALPYFSTDGFAPFLDSFANSLLLLMDVATKSEAASVIGSMMDRLSMQEAKIVPAFWPPITDRSPFWSALKLNSLFEFRNKPHHYHNGGLWPLIQGFFIAALVAQGKAGPARQFLGEFSEVLQRDGHGFHEYYDSKYYQPCGIHKMGFSASGYIIAYRSVTADTEVFA
jgi:hypothetical protein